MSPGYKYGGTEFDAKPRTRPKPVEKPFDPSLCGTPTGVWQHRRLKQPQCSACRGCTANRRAATRETKRAAWQEKKGSG